MSEKYLVVTFDTHTGNEINHETFHDADEAGRFAQDCYADDQDNDEYRMTFLCEIKEAY